MAGIELIQNSTLTGTLTVSGDTTIASDVYITAGALSITGDGSNAATLTESGNGDFTIESKDDLRLDSGGNDIVLRGASSAEFGRLSNDSQNFEIKNTTADKDINIIGKDGISTITALTFDMSEAGYATFNNGATFGGDVIINNGDAYNQLLITNATGASSNKQSGIMTLNYAGNNVSIFETYCTSTGNTIYYGSADGNYRGITDHRFYVNTAVDATTSHTEALHIDSDLSATFAGNIILDDNDGNSPYVQFINSDNDEWYIQNNSSSKLRFVQNGTERGLWSSGELELTNALIIGSISEIGSDTDKFLMSDSGTVKYVTGANLLTYIGGAVGSDYLPLAGGTMTGTSGVVMPDNFKLNIGTGSDLQMFHDATDSIIDNNVGHLYITQNADDKDLIFRSDDGSGGVTAYFYLDGSEKVTRFPQTIRFEDSTNANFGASSDLRIYHNASDSHIDNYTGNLNIVNNANDADINFYSDDGSGSVAVYFYLDGSAVNGSTVLGATKFPDKSKIYMGTSSDLELFHDGANTYIENYTGTFFISQLLDDGDLVLQCDNGSGGSTAYLTLDGSAGYTTAQKDIRFDDGIAAAFGTDIDAFIKHSGSEFNIYNDVGAMNFIQRQDDGNMVFQSDDGSAGTATYFSLDGGSSATNELYTKWPDYSRIALGTGKDLLLYHDASHSYIQDVGTGNLYIDGANNIQIRSAVDSALSASFSIGGGGILYYGGSNKLETTAAGITTAIITATGGTSTEWNTAYDNHITGISDSGTSTVTLTLTQQDSGTLTTSFSVPQGTVTGATSANTDLITVSASSTSPVITGITAAVSGVSANLATGAQIQTAIDAATTGVLSYQGTWNANTNTPTLASGTGTGGYYYIVSVAGTTTLDGISEWAVGDWAIFAEDGASDHWQKIDNSSTIAGGGDANKLAVWSDANTLTYDTDFYVDSDTIYSVNLSATTLVDTPLVRNTALQLGRDTHNYITFETDDQIVIRVADSHRVKLDATGLNPYSDSAYDLGTSSVRWKDAYLDTTYSTKIGVATTSINAGIALQVSGTAYISTGLKVSDISAAYIGSSTNMTFTTGSTGEHVFHCNSADQVNIADGVMYPETDSDVDLGKTGQRFATLYVDTIVSAGTLPGGPYLPLAGGTMTGNTIHNDDVKDIYGTSSDGLEIYHSGSDSYIRDTGTGSLRITTNRLTVLDENNSETMIDATQNAGVLLYYDNSNVLETVAAGAMTKFDGGSAAIGYTIHNEGTATGDDVKIAFETQGAMDWAIGIDKSDSNKFKLSQSENLGTNDRLEITSAGTATFAGDIIIPATKALYLDDGGGTYIYESSDGVIDFYGDTVQLLTAKQNGTQSEVVVNEGSGDVDFRVEANTNNHAFFVEAEGGGKVGVLTSDPLEKFDTPNIVIGGSTISGTYRANALFIDNNAGASRFYSTGADGTTSGSYQFAVAASDGDPLTTVLTLGSDSSATFAGVVNIGASQKIYLGGSTARMQVYHTGSSGEAIVLNKEGNLSLINQSHGDDIVFKTEDSGGSVIQPLILDSGGDATFVGSIGTTGDMVLKSDGIACLTMWDSGGVGLAKFHSTVKIPDKLEHDGDDNTYLSFSAADNIKLVAGGKNVLHAHDNGSLYLYGDNGTALTLDGSQDATFANDILTDTDSSADIGKTGTRWANLWVDSINGATPAVGASYLPLAGGTMTGDVIYDDDVKIKLGSGGGNSDIYHNGTDMFMRNVTTAGDMSFAADSTGSGGTATAYFWLDGGIVKTRVAKDMNFETDVKASFGTVSSPDLEIYHDGDSKIDNFTGDLYIRNYADNKHIYFECDNGSGGVTPYFFLDGATSETNDLITTFPDYSRLTFGTGRDLKIYHDASNSYIQDSGTGSLKVCAANWHLMNSAATEYMATGTPDGPIILYYDNASKFSTLTTGIGVTGVVYTSDGNKGAPAYSFTGDTNTGMFSDSADHLAFSAGGNESMSVDTSAISLNVDTTLTSSNLILDGDSQIELDDTPGSGNSSGTIIKDRWGDTVVYGKCYYLSNPGVGDGEWVLAANDDDDEFAINLLTVAVGTNSTTHGMLYDGIYYDSSHGFTIGAPLYLGASGAGFTNTTPSGGGDKARVVGYAISDDEIYFHPDNAWVTID